MKKIGLLSVTSILLISLCSSCSNFLQGENLKKELDRKITYENYQINTIFIAADEGFGTTIPSGNVQLRQTDSLEISFSASDNAVFQKWQTIDKSTKKAVDAGIRFDDPYSKNTTVRITGDSSNVQIRPLCFLKTESEKPVFSELTLTRKDDNTPLTDKAFTNWTAQDYETNHVNGFNVSFKGVDKGSGIYSMKIVEILETEFTTGYTGTPSIGSTLTTEVSENIKTTEKDGEYVSDFTFSFQNDTPGLYKLEFTLCDNSGNISTPLIYYAIKDSISPDVFITNTGVKDGKTTFILYDFDTTKAANDTYFEYNPYTRTICAPKAECYNENPLRVTFCPTGLGDRWYTNKKTDFKDFKISYKFHNQIYAVPESCFTSGHQINWKNKNITFSDCFVEVSGINSNIDEEIEFYIQDKAGNVTTVNATIPKNDPFISFEVMNGDELHLFAKKISSGFLNTSNNLLIKKSNEQNYNFCILGTDRTSDGLVAAYSDYEIFSYDSNKKYDVCLVKYNEYKSNLNYNYFIYGDYTHKTEITGTGPQINDANVDLSYSLKLISDGKSSGSFTLEVSISEEDLQKYDAVFVSNNNDVSYFLDSDNKFRIPITYKRLLNPSEYNFVCIKENKKDIKKFNIGKTTPGFEDNVKPALNAPDLYKRADTVGQLLNLFVSKQFENSSFLDSNGECKMYYCIRQADTTWTASTVLENAIPESEYKEIDSQYLLSYNYSAGESGSSASFTLPVAGLEDKPYIIFLKFTDAAGNTAFSGYYFYKYFIEKPDISVSDNKVTVTAEDFKGVSFGYYDTETSTWKQDKYNNSSGTNEYTKINNYNKSITTDTCKLATPHFIRTRIYSVGELAQGFTEYSNRIFKISPPVYYYTGLGSNKCKTKVMLNALGGYVVYSDYPVYLHTVYDTKDWGEDPDVWERQVLDSQKVNPLQTEAGNAAYTVDTSEIPDNAHYRVIAHFADGTSLMSEDFIKTKGTK